ncbi:hypothetical protein FB45DRAFT_966282 [Roridomyces roridus]|uniref:SUZ domain-containing protein n=1 Tax=Roridomyces roridus TaxID=1738132 RepID=A0AAD7AXS7_9AGAR|nr:hypothetical protein FB45DRAFT_966282 [Roridomyces roridus]
MMFVSPVLAKHLPLYTMAATADWDHQPLESTSASAYPTAQTFPVSDDWEDDDEDNGESDTLPNPEKNQRIWENANAASPMPNVILAPSRSSSATGPPAAALQPALRILKRPPQAPGQTTPPPATQGETLEERDARYQAARARIFGSAEESTGPADGSTSAKGKKEKQKGGGGSVTRHPRGPEQASSFSTSRGSPTPLSKGFKPRSAQAPPPTTAG